MQSNIQASGPPEEVGCRQKILVLDDELDVGMLVVAAAESMNIPCTATCTAVEFLERFDFETTLIVLDLMMPELDGVEMLRILSKAGCEAGIILASGMGKRVMETTEDLAKNLSLRIVGHLQKPFRIAELKRLIRLAQEPPQRTTLHQACAKKVFGRSELCDALQKDQLVLHYQPQIDIPKRSVTGVEALVRWQHPAHGLIYPNDFVDQMESAGLETELCWSVARRGLAEVSRFAGPGGELPLLSLNVSVASLQRLDFPDMFMELVQSSGVEASNVVIEITEGGLIKELATTLDVLIRLRMKGIQLSIDDFGTGYSMMSQVRNIPATELKVDRSFVSNVFASDGNRVMVEKTIEIGHDLGMKVVAEGVETKDQLDFLASCGCDVGQGYHFSRPLCPADLEHWLIQFQK